MLRVIQNSRADGAKSYYSTADYYTEGQELTGGWHGKGAARLGLEGAVEKRDWDALCDNRDPSTGKVLTPRQKDNRRIGYDFNFHVPKSVSLLYGMTGDDRILAAFRGAVDATMQDIEAEMQTRVRVGGKNEDRTTGNLVWGEFVHTTARPVDGVPDPHLHAHCFVFNTTWDETESRWKAGQFAGLKRDAPYFEALFHSRLAGSLEALGLDVQRTRRGWELAAIPQATLRAFSRRTALIEEMAREKGVADAEAKGALGAKTREKKRKQLTMPELRDEWDSRMSTAGRTGISNAVAALGGPAIEPDRERAAEAVGQAVAHCFERSSVVPERKLLTEALKRSYGTASPETVGILVADQQLLVASRDGERLATTNGVLAEESRMIAFARDGRGVCEKLVPGAHTFTREWLNDGQRRAAAHVLASRDRVTIVRGAAGVGKTAMMQEAVGAMERAGRKVFVFAPSADASRGVLREQEGFKEADTVARLLVDEKLQERVRGQVVWIDEAGLLGTRTMAQVFELAEKCHARVVLSGDRKQHGSVERGAALRLLEEEAGVVPAEIKEIQRQKGEYKSAVQALADGRTDKGFRELDRLGWIREVPSDDRYRLLARGYVATVNAGKTALVVSPTHREGERVTMEIRDQLKRDGGLGKRDHRLTSLVNLNLTEAERRDPINYAPGDVLVFHQNAKGFRKGERVAVGAAELPLDQAERFQVFRKDTLPVAGGEVLRITRNGATADGKHRLNNGQLVQVKSVTRRGDLELANGWTVAGDYGHFAPGYVVTSHASQGKTVDRVFIGQSVESAAAASREQFYVSVSRGRERVTIYTDDKRALLAAVQRSDERMTASDLMRAGRPKARRPTRRRAKDEPTVALAAAARESELHHDQ